MLSAGRSRVQFRMRSLGLSINLILPAALWAWFDSASNRNEYQESFFLGCKRRQVYKADNLTAICEPII
jgi:hypothetical protein